MWKRFKDWLDDRIAYRKLVDALLLEHIPGGAKWRYVWGSCLVFVFAIQLVTGILLMTAYSPGDSTAWSSVYFIQYEMDFGWLIRGLHHFGSQTMVVLLGLHMLQVVIAGAHLPPREVNWWLGLMLMGLILALSLTGYLLPWDQKGYWATQVATKIAGNLPWIGPWMEKVVVGGPSYGHHTLTRFYALHVGVLPLLVIVLIIAHLAVFRKHGVTHPKDPKGEGYFWPDQAFRDLAVSLLIFGAMLWLVFHGHGNPIEQPASQDQGWYDSLAHAGKDGKGAHLDAPADPSKEYPARPEWYFLFLFQLLKYFKGEQEIIGTVVIPMVAGLLLFTLPLLGHGSWRKFGHIFGIVVVVGLLSSVGLLTYLAFDDDANDADHQRRVQEADVHARRAVQLAKDGVPADGAVNLLRRDPLTRGKDLFKQHCAMCHSYKGEFDQGEFRAPDLNGFGSRPWTRDFLDDPGADRFFGRTKEPKLSGMASEILKQKENAKTPEAQAKLKKDFDDIADWLATHPTPKENDKKHPGYLAFKSKERRCSNCHIFEEGDKQGLNNPPYLDGYGSPAWVRMMMMSPDHEQRYGSRNIMPAFRNLDGHVDDIVLREYALVSGKDPEELKKRLVNLSDLDRELIIRWMFKDYRVVFGGTPLAAPKK